MESKYIAAIEIGSSKIKGIVASVDSDGGIAISAVEETDTGDSVRYGRVQNAREVATRVNEIIRRLENNPRLHGGRISTVFVALGGRSVLSQSASSEVSLAGEVEITQQILEKLHKEARYNLATDRDVIDISDRRFVVDGTEVRKIVGTFGNVVSGDFTFVTASPDNRRNLDRVRIESHDTDVTRQYVPRTAAIAALALSDSERQLGTLLIDMGAETTTLAIYRNNALQLLATLPMGAANITRDLSAALGITFEAAENLKVTKGKVAGERLRGSDDPDRDEIINYTSARAGEIIANVLNYIATHDYKVADLPGGIVITGGGSRLDGIAEYLQNQTGGKVRHAVIDSTIGGAPYNKADNIDVIALVKYAADRYTIDCLTFDARTAPATTEPPKAQPSQATATGKPAFAPAATAGSRRPLDENDPRLLEDDLDEVIEQPANVNPYVNLKPDDELPEDDNLDAEEKRRGLFSRFTDWLRQPKDSVLDNENETTNDLD